MAAALASIINVDRIDPNTYRGFVHPDHCFGQGAVGGYLVSLIHSAVKTHFQTSGNRTKEHEPFNFNVNFLRPTMAGDVTIAIKDTKLSPTACTYHVSVIQHDRECVVGYINCANLHSVEGISLPTNFRLDPAPPPSHLESLASKGADDMWISYSYPWYSESPTKALSHWRHFVPRCKTTHPSIVEFWVRVIPDDLNITTEMLGTVVDQYPRPIENYRQGSPISATALAKGGARQLNGEQLEDEKSVVLPHQYTILSLGLEIKKPLPAAGVRWLFLRVRARKIENGRFDSEVIVSDENFELVAVSNQVNLILDKGPGSGSKRRIAASLASQKL